MTELDVEALSSNPRAQDLPDFVTLEVVSSGPCALTEITFWLRGEETQVLRGPWIVEASLPARTEPLDSWSVAVFDACGHAEGIKHSVME